MRLGGAGRGVLGSKRAPPRSTPSPATLTGRKARPPTPHTSGGTARGAACCGFALEVTTRLRSSPVAAGVGQRLSRSASPSRRHSPALVRCPRASPEPRPRASPEPCPRASPGALSPSLPRSPVPEPPRSPLRMSVVLGIITQVERARARARTGRTAPPPSVHRQLWAGAASTPPAEAPVPRPGVCRKDEPQREGLGVFHLLRGCHLITIKASPPRSVGCPGRSSSRAPGHVRWQLPPSPPRPATHARPPETVQRHLPLHVLCFCPERLSAARESLVSGPSVRV